MYNDQTENVIKQRMLAAVTNNIDKTEGSFMHDTLAPVAIELAQAYIELDRIMSMAFAQTASGEFLEKRAKEFGIMKKEGTKATGTVRFTGNDGVIIPSNTLMQTPNGLAYKTLSASIINNGIADISIEAAEIGVIYNVPSNTINQLPVQIVGITSVTNLLPIIGGTDVESDTDLLARLLIKVQQPVTSGNPTEYKTWALSVNGVGGSKVFPLWNGNGTVKVVIIDSNKQPAGNELITNVFDFIESVRPIGALVTVEAAASLNIDINVTVTKDAAYTIQQIQNNISAKVNEFLKSIAFQIDYVSYAQIGNMIIGSEGVLDYRDMTINGGISNIDIQSQQVAVLGTVTVA